MKKKIWILLLSTAAYCTGFGQTLADAIKDYQYERYQSAETKLKELTSREPEQALHWYWLIRTALAQDDTVKASSYFTGLPASIQDQPMSKITHACLSLFKGDSLQAQRLFTEALGTSRKKNPLVQLAIAEANIDAPQGNLYYALDLLTEAARKERKNAAIYMATGDAYRKMYNGSESFRNYQEAAELDKSNPVAYYKMGKIYQTQNNEAVFTEYYDKAIKADPSFGPVYFQLYLASYYKDVNKALGYLQNYISNSDPNIKNDYLLTDLYFVSKKYTDAIQKANELITVTGNKPKPRIYKLLAYSYDAENNNPMAEESLKKYFSAENDSNYAASDFELMAKISTAKKEEAEAAIWYEKAVQVEKETAKKTAIVKKLTQFYKSQKLYDKQAYWYQQLYQLDSTSLNNVDIFSWGVANYNAQLYPMADSVFAIYEKKYPEQSFGYYWRARSNAAMDTAMETGIAIPHYEDLIRVGMKDSANATTKKWLIQAYGYIAAFKVNKEKKYDDALSCYDKILELDPGNNDAEKYKAILEKMMEAQPSAAETPKGK